MTSIQKTAESSNEQENEGFDKNTPSYLDLYKKSMLLKGRLLAWIGSNVGTVFEKESYQRSFKWYLEDYERYQKNLHFLEKMKKKEKKILMSPNLDTYCQASRKNFPKTCQQGPSVLGPLP